MATEYKQNTDDQYYEDILQQDRDVRPSVYAFQRVGVGNVLGSDKITYKDTINFFLQKIEILSQELNILKGDLLIIRTLVEKNKDLNVEFKNPLAFMLGYFATDGGRVFRDLNLKKVKKILSNKQNENVTLADVIRYGRLLIRIEK
jgi:hypothetical protein